jgi:hypothetical protein
LFFAFCRAAALRGAFFVQLIFIFIFILFREKKIR